ncbi:ABC transporter [bacterium CG_4_10_14_0_2_um_filter_33_32]|nr:MAG: ABC transporter [bacterium CG2_30_33_46]PIR67906.1 MAG: ABC transporter [bacterium CG10_big_fil_rev_8_21_14_0_10_33_18]PIU76917.1 MAG: ABC transporter [bacterium CG06_land_8_20_14_3_00_33_50]PIW81493.1 MAG: ABC transporter [bacterium CG_4_8_14_3_um_filter_33_28]PIY85665.1 MAG: ABC transporter [bacterium CG_4_10_14_0_8_um_filter_33_57]PIZ85567.1 MAG: ABC transporter [bacterium CG_4_10_14_0_2_um_filter_33_32]PJA72589.1 MAG: ABC transporter [bacterium CG_4_9_14_3_um_filter_33_26]
MLEVSNITKEFKSGDVKVVAVNNIDFKVPQGKFISIIGKSGSGKSTLLSILGALDRPTSGKIIVDGKDISRMSEKEQVSYRSKEIGFIFQNYNLIPNISALENVTITMEFAGTPSKDRKERATKLLDEVGIEGEKQRRKPGRLSGGEQQRVAIARALANKPKLILADEPTGNLDSQTGKMIFDLLHKLSRIENTTIIAVTHDLSIAGKTDMTFKLFDGKISDSK